mgnify:CR=1 FL=1
MEINLLIEKGILGLIDAAAKGAERFGDASRRFSGTRGTVPRLTAVKATSRAGMKQYSGSWKPAGQTAGRELRNAEDASRKAGSEAGMPMEFWSWNRQVVG